MNGTRSALIAAFVVLSLGMGASAASANTTLRRGDVGLDVLLWQEMLNQMITAEHHVPEDVVVEDGIFGFKTERATKRFERGALFPRDGVVGPRERRRWMGAFITCCGVKKPVVGRGSYSTFVGHIQLEINRWIHRSGSDLQPLTIDLLLGRATESAVRAYQSAHALVVDGVVGPKHGAPSSVGGPGMTKLRSG